MSWWRKTLTQAEEKMSGSFAEQRAAVTAASNLEFYSEDEMRDEGNTRRDAAVELGLPEVPVEIKYFGHAEQQGTVASAFEEDLHPRGHGGKWTSAGGSQKPGVRIGKAVATGFAPPGSHLYPLVGKQPPGVWAVDIGGGGGRKRKLLRLVCNISATNPALLSACATDAQAQVLLSTMADLNKLYPLDPPISASITSAEDAALSTGGPYAMAYTNLEGNHISFVVNTVAVTGFGSGEPNGLGEALRSVGEARYIAAHEYGHAQEVTGSEGAVAALHAQVLALPDAGGLSEYGRSDPVEGYAEAFADYVSTGGRPESVATKAYAEMFGWAR